MADKNPKGKKAGKDDDDVVIKQRYNNNQPQCPTYCKKFSCMLYGDCNQECEKLDQAKAMICELCDNKCETEKQKILLLDTKYYQEKKKLFSSKIFDGVHGIKERHHYLETRYKELKKKMLETSIIRYFKRSEIKSEGSKIRFEIEIRRDDMEMLEIPYTKDVEFDA